MNMREGFVGRAFAGAPFTISIGICLFAAAVIVAEIAFMGAGGIVGCVASGFGLDYSIDGAEDLVFLLAFSFGFGAMSGIGLIFLAWDAWLIYRFLFEEDPAIRFFFGIAANQIGLNLCAAILDGRFFETLPAGGLALLIVVLLFRGTRWLMERITG